MIDWSADAPTVWTCVEVVPHDHPEDDFASGAGDPFDPRIKMTPQPPVTNTIVLRVGLAPGGGTVSDEI